MRPEDIFAEVHNESGGLCFGSGLLGLVVPGVDLSRAAVDPGRRRDARHSQHQAVELTDNSIKFGK